MISVISYRRPIAIGALLTTCTACILTMIQIPIDVQENNVVLPPNNLNCSAQGMYKDRVANAKIEFKIPTLLSFKPWLWIRICIDYTSAVAPL